jgi:hypothetical protein
MSHKVQLSHNNGFGGTVERAQNTAHFGVAATCILQRGTCSYMPVTGDYFVVRLLVSSSSLHVL